VYSGLFNSENAQFCNGKSHKIGTVHKFDSTERDKRNCTHFCCEIRHTMFDAVTDCATESLDVFCAKRMGEQLRNILSYPHTYVLLWRYETTYLILKQLQLI
jgi:hypothetical protein